MKEIKNILICGIGAIGSIYAEKFQQFCPENFRVLVDKNRLERYTNEPLIFNDRVLNFSYVLPEETNFKANLIIIATKNDGLKEAVKNINNFVYEDTVILSLLNGVVSEDIIADEYGWDKVLLSYFIGHSAIRTGRKVIHDDVNNIVFGAKEGLTENVARVKAVFDKTNITYQIPSDMRYALWSKFIFNVYANQTSAVLKMTFGEMQENESYKKLALNIINEVVEIAKAEGVNNAENLTEDVLHSLDLMSPWGKTSMLQDVEAGRKTEADIFAGTVIELGKKHNLKTPYNQMLMEMFEVIHEEQLKNMHSGVILNR